mmetsp:Transcript_21621/g.27960  ORF Transcript_21621/g.27960 Transcript_21621/m.27960 type:complete len:250 (-) Transcript_21621:186-935(-)
MTTRTKRPAEDTIPAEEGEKCGADNDEGNTNEPDTKRLKVKEVPDDGGGGDGGAQSVDAEAAEENVTSLQQPQDASGISRNSLTNICEEQQHDDGEQTLAGIRQAITLQTKAEEDLNVHLLMQMERAQVRLSSGNSTGAVLSMKKVKHFQAQLSKVVEAIDYLEKLEAKLASKLMQDNTAKVLEIAGSVYENDTLETSVTISTAAASPPIDLSEYKDCAEQVQKILLNESKSNFTSEGLIAELRGIPTI